MALARGHIDNVINSNGIPDTKTGLVSLLRRNINRKCTQDTTGSVLTLSASGYGNTIRHTIYEVSYWIIIIFVSNNTNNDIEHIYCLVARYCNASTGFNIFEFGNIVVLLIILNYLVCRNNIH